MCCVGSVFFFCWWWMKTEMKKTEIKHYCLPIWMPMIYDDSFDELIRIEHSLSMFRLFFQLCGQFFWFNWNGAWFPFALTFDSESNSNRNQTKHKMWSFHIKCRGVLHNCHSICLGEDKIIRFKINDNDGPTT